MSPNDLDKEADFSIWQNTDGSGLTGFAETQTLKCFS